MAQEVAARSAGPFWPEERVAVKRRRGGEMVVVTNDYNQERGGCNRVEEMEVKRDGMAGDRGWWRKKGAEIGSGSAVLENAWWLVAGCGNIG
ncbi:hypothetical protein AMTR_s00128p00082160 [Amborella trichopoda]|uniref:Uncharacterized protein n=1 Tax=Amborella trichopoda TaxID=13333 RepID=W1NMQ7_AMBTC|nr:hypothetical protein AMTR_s00128p00082160 [Amborella trichopoda]